MTPSEIILASAQLFIALATLITAVGAMMLSIRGRAKAEAKMDQVEHNTNSIVTKLVATTKTEAHAAGVLDEKENPS